MPDAELVTDAAPRDPTQMLDAFLVAAVRPPLRRLGPPAARVVGLFVGLVAAIRGRATNCRLSVAGIKSISPSIVWELCLTYAVPYAQESNLRPQSVLSYALSLSLCLQSYRIVSPHNSTRRGARAMQSGETKQMYSKYT